MCFGSANTYLTITHLKNVYRYLTEHSSSEEHRLGRIGRRDSWLQKLGRLKPRRIPGSGTIPSPQGGSGWLWRPSRTVLGCGYGKCWCSQFSAIGRGRQKETQHSPRALRQGDGDRWLRAWRANPIEMEISGSEGTAESRLFLLERWALPRESGLSETDASEDAPSGHPQPGAHRRVESGFSVFWAEKGASPHHLKALRKPGSSLLVPGGALVPSAAVNNLP